MPQLVITIDKLGAPVIDAQGFVGGSCKSVTQPLLDLLGGKADMTEKPEMYMGTTEEREELTN